MAVRPVKQRVYANTPRAHSTQFPSWVTNILDNLHLTGQDRITEGNQLLAANNSGVKRSALVRQFGGPATSSNSSAGRPGRTTSTSPISLTQLWVKAGGSPALAPVMAAIAMAESGGRVGAIGGPNTNGTYDYGLWQINSSHGYSQGQLTNDPLYNARAAVAIEKSQGLTAWSTYNNGAYQKFLGQNASVNASSGTNSGGGAGITRPGGQPAGQSGSDVTQILSDWTTSQNAAGSPATDSSGNADVSFGGTVGGILKSPLNPLTGPLSIIPNPLSLFQNLSGSINSVTDFLKLLAWIINPVNILRAVEFLVGLALMVFGLQAMMQAYGERVEGFTTSENALSRSGLGRVSRELASAATTAAAPEAKAAAKARSATKAAKSSSGGRSIRPQSAPHRTRRQALRLRYEREKQVSQRRQKARRQGG